MYLDIFYTISEIVKYKEFDNFSIYLFLAINERYTNISIIKLNHPILILIITELNIYNLYKEFKIELNSYFQLTRA